MEDFRSAIPFFEVWTLPASGHSPVYSVSCFLYFVQSLYLLTTGGLVQKKLLSRIRSRTSSTALQMCVYLYLYKLNCKRPYILSYEGMILCGEIVHTHVLMVPNNSVGLSIKLQVKLYAQFCVYVLLFWRKWSILV